MFVHPAGKSYHIVSWVFFSIFDSKVSLHNKKQELLHPREKAFMGYLGYVCSF